MEQAILFDLDGTLTKSEEGILRSVCYALTKMGRPLPPRSVLLAFIGPPLVDSFMQFSGTMALKLSTAMLAPMLSMPHTSLVFTAVPTRKYLPNVCFSVVRAGVLLLVNSNKSIKTNKTFFFIA